MDEQHEQPPKVVAVSPEFPEHPRFPERLPGRMSDTPAGPHTAVPPLVRIPTSAIPYWQVVLDGVTQADAELAEVSRLEQQIALLKQSATAKIGAYESYAGHLFETLGLDGQTDRIEPDGTINRSGPSSNGTA